MVPGLMTAMLSSSSVVVVREVRGGTHLDPLTTSLPTPPHLAGSSLSPPTLGHCLIHTAVIGVSVEVEVLVLVVVIVGGIDVDAGGGCCER